jgi:hypothetical protein
VNRSLDHVIGVRIPASQPLNPLTTNNLRDVDAKHRTVPEATLCRRAIEPDNLHIGKQLHRRAAASTG